MKYIKMLGLVAVAVAALMAFVGAGSASATELTCEGKKCAIGAAIHGFTGSHATFHPPIGTISCNWTVQGEVTDPGSPATTAKAKLTSHAFTGCTNGVVMTTLAPGTLEFHSAGGGNGTLTWSGSSVTTQYLGFHCIFGTNNTDIGTVTTNTAAGGKATLDIIATIPRTGGSSGAFCGATAQWTGQVAFTKPASLIIH